MNNIKENIIGAIAVIALLVGLYGLVPSAAPQTTSLGATSGTVGGAVTLVAGTQLGNSIILPNPTTYDYLVSRTYLASQGFFGLGNGSAVPTNSTATRLALTSGTSTPCAIQNPLNATSTIRSFTMNITTATSSALTWAVGTSTTAYATTTSMMSVGVGAGKQSTLSWNGGINNSVIGAREYVVVGADTASLTATGAFTSIVIAGSCQVVFQSAN